MDLEGESYFGFTNKNKDIYTNTVIYLGVEETKNLLYRKGKVLWNKIIVTHAA